MRNDDWLNGVMEFDHPVRVNEDGSVTESIYPNIYAPESNIETTHDGSVLKEHEAAWTESMRRQGWEPETNWSSQDRYHGPVMHASEFIGGSLETYILATPGVWVAVSVECLRGDPEGAGEDYDPENHTCEDYADDSPDENPEPAGWAVLHMDDGPDTKSYVVTTSPGEITPALVGDRYRVTLPIARKLAGLVPHLAARIIRVTDLAVLPNDEPDPAIVQRLESLRAALRAENISWGELHELQGLAHLIDPGDTELLEAAGVPEHSQDESEV